MDPRTNPYAPGAGSPPPELAGRDGILSDARVALQRTIDGRPAKGQMLLGLRGVGKTVLLNRILEIAEEEGFHTVLIEAPENKTLPELLVPPLRSVLFRLNRSKKIRHGARQALRTLRSFASAFKVSVGEVEFGVEAEVGSADSGDLNADLPELLLAVGAAAREGETAIALLIDEVQYLSDRDLSALIAAIHKVTQRSQPVIFFGAGLPQLAALAGEAKSYAERLFDYPFVGPLEPADARAALQEPAERQGVAYEHVALEHIVATTQGYPYFLQEWGKHVWDAAAASPITKGDAVQATERAVRQLDTGFFRVRLDRLAPREKDYVRAMAALGAGPHRSGDIARQLGMSVNQAAPLRDKLIRKGMIYSPAHGDTAFTVPMFDEFMRRSIPDPPGV